MSPFRFLIDAGAVFLAGGIFLAFIQYAVIWRRNYRENLAQDICILGRSPAAGDGRYSRKSLTRHTMSWIGSD